jgi:copper chaperone NosL
MTKMNTTSRVITAVASIALIATYFLPVWFIYLLAPQYPEGLSMQIWLNNITGDVNIINGLNHYIGMKHISVEMFPEFTYLIYIVAFFIVFGLVVSITGSRKLLIAYLATTILGGAAALYDFYLWGYDYGHNLDPTAAIQVPGFSYQPPVIGHKTLLNFDAYSYPDVGGWVVIISALSFFGVLIYEIRRNRKTSIPVKQRKKIIPAAVVLLLVMSSCNVEPKPFQYGKDMCSECMMTIMEPGYGAQVITKKGKVYNFDDLHCLVNFYNKGVVKETEIAKTVSIDHQDDKNFIDVESAWFVKSSQLKSPMNSNAASFSSKEKANEIAGKVDGKILSWNDLRAQPNIVSQ